MTGSSFSELRTVLDGSDVFVSGGHGVIKTAGATNHTQRMKRVPVWAFDDDKIKQFINSRFPKSKTDKKQKEQAARIIRFIYLYHRVGATASVVAQELKMSLNAVDLMSRRIHKAMSSPLKPPHRPKNKPDGIDATDEGPAF